MQNQPYQDLKLTPADLFPNARPASREFSHPLPASLATPRSQVTPSIPTVMLGPARVLHVRVVTGCGGGPEKTILRNPSYTDAKRYQIAAAYLYPQGDPGMCVIRQNARQLKCPLYEIAEEHALDHHGLGALIELCRELKVDVWHGHDYKSNLYGLIAKRFHKMKLVTTAHGFTRETWRTRLYYHMDNLAMLGYDRVIAVSPQLVQHCAGHGVNPDRISYIPNAIDTLEYTRNRSQIEAKTMMGMAHNRFAIGVIGRLSIEKGVDRAIRLLPELLKEHPAVELHLIGDGPQRKALEDLARHLGVNRSIVWWGWQTDARPFYEMLDALLLPSRTEGLPNVVLEAMAMGVPVAATNVGGVSDLLHAGDCGIILDNDERTWASQVGSLLSKPRLRASYADLARRRVCEVFGFHKRMQAVMAVYDRVLGRDTPAPSASSHRTCGQSSRAA